MQKLQLYIFLFVKVMPVTLLVPSFTDTVYSVIFGICVYFFHLFDLNFLIV